MLEAALAAARLAHYAAATGLFGLCLFAALAWPVRRGVLIGVAFATLVTTALWLVAGGAAMAGGFDALGDPILQAAVVGTAFGRIGLARLLVAMTICYLAARPAGRVRTQVLTVLSAALLASLALSGHTQIHEGALARTHEALDALHLLGAGAWLGGLASFAVVLRGPGPDIAQKIAAFSKVGYAAVGALVVTGVANAALILPSPAALISTFYGKLLIIKIGLFATMLGLALFNRFRISPAVARGQGAGAAIQRLKGHVMAEQALGALVLVAVSVLGTLDPSV